MMMMSEKFAEWSGDKEAENISGNPKWNDSAGVEYFVSA